MVILTHAARDTEAERRRHIHLLQDEYFQVEQGVLGAVTNGKEHALTKDDGILVIRAGTR